MAVLALVKGADCLLVFMIIGLVIFLHECGHWVGAWIAGIPVRAISVGVAPLLWAFRLRSMRV